MAPAKKAFAGRGPIKNLFAGSFGEVCKIALGAYMIILLIDHDENFAAQTNLAWLKIASTWSNVYDRSLNYFDGDVKKSELFLIVGVTQIFHMTTFWIHCTLLALLDMFPTTFSFAHKWRIQNPGEPVNKVKMLKTMLVCLFNQTCINGPLAYVLYTYTPIFAGMAVAPTLLPSFKTFVKDMIAFGVIEEVGFYYGHRFMHIPQVYKSK